MLILCALFSAAVLATSVSFVIQARRWVAGHVVALGRVIAAPAALDDDIRLPRVTIRFQIPDGSTCELVHEPQILGRVYHVGDAVPVHVDPHAPTDAGVATFAVVFGGPTIGIALGLCGLAGSLAFAIGSHLYPGLAGP